MRRMSVAACELVLEALVARKKISRSDGGHVRPRRARAAPAAEPGSLRRRLSRRTMTAAASSSARLRGERRGDARPAGDSARSRRRSSSCGWRCCASTRTIRSTAGCAPTRTTRARDLFAAQLASPDETMFLAERDGRRRRHPALRRVDRARRCSIPERYCYVSSVYVRPEERRRGVLRALVERGGAMVRASAGSTRCGCTTSARHVDAPSAPGKRSASRSSSRCDAARSRVQPPTPASALMPRHHDLAHVRLRRLGGRRARRDGARLDAVRQRDGRRGRASARD